DTAKLRDIAKDAAQKQADAEKRGDFAGATVNAAVKKAAETASSAATQAAKDKEQELKGLIRHEVIFKISIVPYGEGEVKPYYKNTHFYHSIPITGGNGAQLENGRPTVYVSNYMEYVSVDAPSYDPRKEYLVANSASWKPQSGMGEAQAKSLAEQMALNDKDLADILKRMLESQQTNHEELMNQLAKMGDVVQQSTTSQEWTAKTATTSPYTPAGSDTPQQTQFTIDQNGNITATTIMRPDLKPNSSQAPMRTEVIKNPNAQSQNQQGQQQGEMQGQNQQGHQTNQQGQHQNQQAPNTNQTGQQQNQQQQNFCQQNPRSASCADLGEADYEDLAIPEQVIDFNLVPLDVFQNNGICPASKTFDLGVLGTFEVSYEHACYVASLLRPILILINMMGCFSFAYAAVREI
uniref:IgG-binding virulence factor TspB family protein n=1 Tax=Neisseria weaveri TaxID=28091 RepID=UPI002279C02B